MNSQLRQKITNQSRGQCLLTLSSRYQAHCRNDPCEKADIFKKFVWKNFLSSAISQDDLQAHASVAANYTLWSTELGTSFLSLKSHVRLVRHAVPAFGKLLSVWRGSHRQQILDTAWRLIIDWVLTWRHGMCARGSCSLDWEVFVIGVSVDR